MSLSAKKFLEDSFQEKLADLLTVNQSREVMDILQECLEKCEVDVLGTEDPGFDLLKAFLEAKRVEGCSEQTLKHYEFVIGSFLKKLSVSASKVSVYHLRSYFADESQRGVSNRTLHNNRNVFSSFFGWLHTEELIKKNPCANLNRIKYTKVVRKPFSPAEIEKLKENSNTRDKAIICLLLSTGCRVSELCRMNRKDVNFEKREIVVFGKGAKQRTVYFDDVTAMLLTRYLDSRNDDHEALFIGKGTPRLQKEGIEKMLREKGEKCNIPNVHPHRFRRTMATGMISKGMPIQEVAVLLGHEKIETTMNYIYIEQETVKNNYLRLA